MDRPKPERGRSNHSIPFTNPDRRGASGARGEVAEEAFSPLSLADETTGTGPRAILKRIGDDFNAARDTNRTGAYSSLLHDLWANVADLVPAAIILKDLIDKSVTIEDFIKNDQGSSAKEPLEVFREWLNTDTRPQQKSEVKSKVH